MLHKTKISSNFAPRNYNNGPVAQLDRATASSKLWVKGSNPFRITKRLSMMRRVFLLSLVRQYGVCPTLFYYFCREYDL